MYTSWTKLLTVLTLCSAATLGACATDNADTSTDPDASTDDGTNTTLTSDQLTGEDQAEASDVPAADSSPSMIEDTGTVAVDADPSLSTAATKCRDAYVSTTGAWGSARICWSPSTGGYKATVNGTVKDTKGDSRRARLYVSYYISGRNTDQGIATANPAGHTSYGSWSKDHVRDVAIYVCTVDRFGTTYHCSKNG